jgi:hypothetical protein
MRIVKHWFGYRKKNPSGNRNSDLDHIVATSWTSDMTTELLELLNVLGRCVALQPRQVDILNEIMTAPQITVADLEDAGVLPVPAAAAKEPKSRLAPDLWQGTEQPVPDDPANVQVPKARQSSDDLLGIKVTEQAAPDPANVQLPEARESSDDPLAIQRTLPPRADGLRQDGG